MFDSRFRMSFAKLILLGSVAVLFSHPVSAVEVCIIDDGGVNDEPNQKDMTQLCREETADKINVSFSFDDALELNQNTNNDNNLCITFLNGTANDKVDGAFCVIVDGQLSNFKAAQGGGAAGFYPACTDKKVDNCGDNKDDPDFFGADTVDSKGVFDTSKLCELKSQQATDPFTDGDDAPLDTTIKCSFPKAIMGSYLLWNVCSHTSASPTSNATECIINPANLGNARAGLKKSYKSYVDNDGSGDISVGDTVTYTIVGSNAGVLQLTNAKIADSTIGLAAEDCATGGTLGAFEYCTKDVSYTLQASDVSGGELLRQ